jgi:hypothetical protein
MPSSSSSATIAVALVALAGSTGCSSSLSAPFNGMKDSPTTQMTVYQLQDYEPPAAPTQAAMPGGLQLPPMLQQWVQAGASLLPPGLIPPGLLPGSAPPPPAAANAPRFHNFLILKYQQVTDTGIRGDVLDTFGHQSNFQNSTQACPTYEFGFAISQPNNPTPADILVSLSCRQVQAFNFAWPYQQTALSSDTEKKISDITQRVFQFH